MLKIFCFSLLYILVSLPAAQSIACYQCNNDPDPYCHQRTCYHGLYAGAQSEYSQNKVINLKGCQFLPFTGLEGCHESTLFGDIRQVTCFCHHDFCNAANSHRAAIPYFTLKINRAK
ncbi:putative lymphocyte antigen 6I [Trichinella spiralis]|uniref:putative lymphocyte antigen 6I n=1 Tax=Trichinella spiralis TaxID=6334 RepID=UPI0001EFB8AC|nr:putative lymphocyte antigen 6I [Trichinella spiralis]